MRKKLRRRRKEYSNAEVELGFVVEAVVSLKVTVSDVSIAVHFGSIAEDLMIE